MPGDSAELKIVLSEESAPQVQPATPAAPPAQPVSIQPAQPAPVQQVRPNPDLDAAFGIRPTPATPPAPEPTPTQPTEPAKPEFDPVEEARRQIEAEHRRRLIQEARAKLQPPEPEKPFNPEEEANRQLEAEDRRRAVQEARNRLRPPEPEKPFDPAEEARRQLEAEDRRRAVKEAREKLRPTEEVGEVGEAAGGVVEALGSIATVAAPVVAGIAAVGVAAGAVVIAFKSAAEAFIARGQELQRFSPQLAGANAIAEVRQTMGDIREAQALGPGIASITDSFSQIWDQIREILLPIQRAVVNVIADVLEGINDFIQAMKPILDAIAEFIAYMIKAVGEIINILKIIAKLNPINWLLEFFKDTEQKKEHDKFASFGQKQLDLLKNQVDMDILAMQQVGGPVVPGAADQNINPPLFKGLNLNPIPAAGAP